MITLSPLSAVLSKLILLGIAPVVDKGFVTALAGGSIITTEPFRTKGEAGEQSSEKKSLILNCLQKRKLKSSRTNEYSLTFIL